MGEQQVISPPLCTLCNVFPVASQGKIKICCWIKIAYLSYVKGLLLDGAGPCRSCVLGLRMYSHSPRWPIQNVFEEPLRCGPSMSMTSVKSAPVQRCAAFVFAVVSILSLYSVLLVWIIRQTHQQLPIPSVHAEAPGLQARTTRVVHQNFLKHLRSRYIAWDLPAIVQNLGPGLRELAYYLCRTYGHADDLMIYRRSWEWQWNNVDIIWVDNLPPGFEFHPALKVENGSLPAEMCRIETKKIVGGTFFSPCARQCRGLCVRIPCFYPWRLLWIYNSQ